MTDSEIENIIYLLKTHYGATKVFVDNEVISVYGSNIDSVCVAVDGEYGDEYDIICERQNDDLKEVVLRLVKKSQKDVDKIK